ncbi:DUF2515 family protein [Paenibacillus humicus]|uniref:DUF2515 family protein n=1 Tax=Paenibacillus humicus TaxID=412861 RepID=UPI003F5CD9DE
MKESKAGNENGQRHRPGKQDDVADIRETGDGGGADGGMEAASEVKSAPAPRRHPLLRLLLLPAALPLAAAAYAAAKRRSRRASRELAERAAPLTLTAPSVAELRAAWQKLERTAAKKASFPAPGWLAHPHAVSGKQAALPSPDPAWAIEAAAAPGTPPQAAGPAGDAALLQRIRAETARMNRNNLTRTEAYRQFYLRRPEVHWALLAHMVSRNGGWNMTDLQAEWLPRLLDTAKRRACFGMLERANALIFHDAYAQLLLYEESRRSGRSLLHLLPALGVSAFMRPVWQQFLRTGDAVPLTIGLIVNEQNFIESRVVQNAYYRRKVLGTFYFGMQSVLQLNQVVFPYGRDESGEPLLAGLILEDFSDLKERIEFGKRLYALLFGVPGVAEGVLEFAKKTRHTGSRSDYAPAMYASVRRSPPTAAYRERLSGGRLRDGAEPLYSPPLQAAWSDRPVDDPEPGDWFAGTASVLPYFRGLPLPHPFEMTADYRIALGKVELAVLAAQAAGAAAKPVPWTTPSAEKESMD